MKSMFPARPKLAREGEGLSSRLVLILFVLTLGFWVLMWALPRDERESLKAGMVAASQVMAEATTVLRRCRQEAGIAVNRQEDIHDTGYIGSEFSPITTTVGRLGAKRTTANPNFAGLVVLLLHRAGVRRGDTIAVGASGSFPALIVAVLAASRAMDLNPLVMPSLGASQWGANRLDFHWLDMYRCLQQAGLFSTEPVAVSLGGDRDGGENMTAAGRRHLQSDLAASGLAVIREQDLAENVRTRMDLYERAAADTPIKAFINIGGSTANIGADSEILRLPPGLSQQVDRLPPPERRGVLFAMAARDIPVIHLLYVRGLAREYGLPWDPAVLPLPGEGALYSRLGETSTPFLVICLGYLAAVLFALLTPRLRRTSSSVRIILQ